MTTSTITAAPFVRGVRWRAGAPPVDVRFPFDLPALSSLGEGGLPFERPVTFLVGENGSGKSTLLEALAQLAGCVAMGGADLQRDATLEPARQLANELVLDRRRLPRRRLFFRAEDAFGFTQRVGSEARALHDLEEEFREQFEDGSWAQRLAMGSARGQRRALEERYGEDPDARSHGETFLHLLHERVLAEGLYLLDEPETPLSPVSQLALLRLLREAVDGGGQFLIATHAPLLMALPGAQILWFDDQGIRPIDWRDVEHVAITRAFLEDPERYLRRL